MECSCLARCDRGAAVGRPTGEIEERINGAPACAALLRKMGYTIDQRLSDAYTATERADELVAEGRGEEALNAYKRAFSLAIAAGLGLNEDRPRQRGSGGGSSSSGSRSGGGGRSSSSSGGGSSSSSRSRSRSRSRSSSSKSAAAASSLSRRLRPPGSQRGPEIYQGGSPLSKLQYVIEPGTTYVRGEPRGSGGGPASRTRSGGLATPAQRLWLAQVMTKRSRLYSSLAAPSPQQPFGLFGPFGEPKATRRAIEDAEYAVQLARSTVPPPSPDDLPGGRMPGGRDQIRFREDDSGRLRLATALTPTTPARTPTADGASAAAAAGGRGGGTGTGTGTGDGAEEAEAEEEEESLGPVLAGPVLAESPQTRKLRPPPSVLTEAWERLAESYEGARDIEGAIFAYEQLLSIEPPSARWLAPTASARRAVQELVLLSHRRGIVETQRLADGLQSVGDSSRFQITQKAIADLEGLRKVVEQDLDALEAFANFSAPGTPQYLSANPGAIGAESNGLIGRFATKSLQDLRIVRKLARNDINRLELTILRGDPFLAAVRDLARSARRMLASGGGAPGGGLALGKALERADVRALPAELSADQVAFDAASVAGAGAGEVGELSGALPTLGGTDRLPTTEREQGLWLRQQFERGALPRDPLLVKSLLEQAERNPELVARLVTQAKDADGRDLFETSAA